MGKPIADMATCKHDRIAAWRDEDGMIAVWACAECSWRFYPSCSICIDVGHRSGHPLSRTASRGSPASIGRPARDHPNVEAGDYIEDDPKAWDEWLATVSRYVPDYQALVGHFGDKAAAEIVAGTMLSYLADRYGIYLIRGDAERVEEPRNG